MENPILASPSATTVDEGFVMEDGGKQKGAVVFSEEKLYASDIFRMFCFKVLPCCKLYNHNWKTCPFLHEGEKAGRRDPQRYRYVGIECLDAKKAECPRGDVCPYAHNLFEFWLHPSRYRTQLCNKPSACRRKVCFFAHNVKELRQPSMGATESVGCALQAPDDTDHEHSEELTEDASLASDSSLGQMTSSRPPLSRRHPLLGRRSETLDEMLYTAPHSFACERSASAQLHSDYSPVSHGMSSELKLRKACSTFNQMRDTPTPPRMSPTIQAFRASPDCQQEMDTQSLFGVIQDSECCKEIHVWRAETFSSEGSVTNVSSATMDGEA